VMKISTLYIQSQAIRTAAELGVAEALRNGPKTCTELATELAINSKPLHAENLCRVLRALEQIGVFKQVEHETFANTPLSDVLREDHPVSQKDFAISFNLDHYEAMGNLLNSVKTGGIAFEDLHNGQNLWTYLSEHQRERKLFHGALDSIQNLTNKAVVEDYPHWINFESICDVGGGAGRLVTAILKSYPTVKRSVIFDLPEVVQLAQQRFLKEEPAEVTSKIEFSTGSFFDSPIPVCQAYILKQILHDWNDEDCIKILRNVRKYMPANSKIFIIDNVITPEDPLPVMKKVFVDLIMMTMLPGKERTEKEFSKLFSSAGLKLENVYETRGLFSIVEASASN